MNNYTRAIAGHLSALLAGVHHLLDSGRHDERGSATIQEVLLAIAALGFVALVVAAINAFLNHQIAFLR